MHFVRASSYGSGTQSSGAVGLGELPDLAGESVIVVDDILDTGRTLARVSQALEAQGPASIRSCVLLDKPARRDPALAGMQADYAGFTVPDAFVVGYGLDLDGYFRHLPDVCLFEPSGSGQVLR